MKVILEPVRLLSGRFVSNLNLEGGSVGSTEGEGWAGGLEAPPSDSWRALTKALRVPVLTERASAAERRQRSGQGDRNSLDTTCF